MRQSRVDYLFPARIAYGQVTMLEGRKGVGKSTIACAVAADVTGGPRLSRGAPRLAGKVHWYAAEESISTATRPKLEAAGADLDHVLFLGATERGIIDRRLLLPADLWALQRTLQRDGCRLLVLDPFSSCVGAGINMNDESQAKLILDPLAAMAGEIGCAILLLRHLRKMTGGPALDQGLGSVAVANVARSVLRCDVHPDDVGYVLSQVATNNGANAPSLHFTLEDSDGVPKVVWGAVSELDAESLSAGFGDVGERDERGDARTFLKRMLGAGWVMAREVITAAQAAGISLRTLRRVKADLRVQSRFVCNQTTRYHEWGPPPDGFPS